MASSPRDRKPAAVAASTEVIENKITLADVIEATKAGNFVYTSPEFHNPLIESGEVVINLGMIDEHGNIATRAILKKEKTVMTESAVTAKPKFEIEADVAIPERVRKSGGLRAGRMPVYPFDGLEIGQSFFVPNKEGAKTTAAKAMASTVAGANARFTEVVEGETRVNRKGATVPKTIPVRLFKVFDTERAVMVDGVETKQLGARVFRVELPA